MEHQDTATAAPPSRADRRAWALHAAVAVARRQGIAAGNPKVLHDANNIVVHLAPSPIVAKVCRATPGDRGWCKLAAELDIADHLVGAGAPVVVPSPELPAGPYSEDGYAITFWRHHHHDSGAPASGRAAGQALANVHRALDGYPGPLPSFLDRQPRRTSRILADPAALPALQAQERAFLRSELTSLLTQLGECRLDSRALHGDPHRGNLLVSRGEYLMIDFESVCWGPLEWDLSALPGGGAGVFAVNQQLLMLLRRLRSLCVAVWCWTRPVHAIELDRAARAHFNLLREGSRRRDGESPFAGAACVA
jgi:phosphotransferase family enzyme